MKGRERVRGDRREKRENRKEEEEVKEKEKITLQASCPGACLPWMLSVGLGDLLMESIQGTVKNPDSQSPLLEDEGSLYVHDLCTPCNTFSA